MRSVLFLCLATGFLAVVALGQEQTGNTPAAGNPSSTSTETAKPKKPKAKHVYTNEDIPERAPDKGAPGAVSSAANENGAPAKANPKGNAKDAAKAKSPEAIEAANAKVEKLKQEEATAASAVQSVEQMISEGGESRKNTMGDSLQQLKAKLEQIKSQRAAAESDLDKLKGN